MQSTKITITDCDLTKFEASSDNALAKLEAIDANDSNYIEPDEVHLCLASMRRVRRNYCYQDCDENNYYPA